eukprot:1304701-Prymnesium_polylepis.1
MSCGGTPASSSTCRDVQCGGDTLRRNACVPPAADGRGHDERRRGEGHDLDGHGRQAERADDARHVGGHLFGRLAADDAFRGLGHEDASRADAVEGVVPARSRARRI